ncbi:MAG: PAS domain S-box protein [Polyangiaceae bacterium]
MFAGFAVVLRGGLRCGNDHGGLLERAFENMQLEIDPLTEALRRSELRFRALLEHSADGIAVLDADAKFTYLSPSVSVIEGYSLTELVGRSALENIHPDDLQPLRDTLQRLMAQPGKPTALQWRRRHKGGRWLWLEGVATNLLTDPAVAGLVISYRDISERKRAEARFRRLLDSNAQGVIFWNTGGDITEANDAFLALVGHTREDLIAGRVSWAAMTPPEYAHLDQHALAEMSTQGHCTPFEKEYIRSDGSRVPVLIGAATFVDAPGEGVCFVLDITPQKQAAEARRVSESRYRTLFEYAPDGIVIADQRSYYLDANTSLCRMLGYTRDELIKLHASDIVAPAEVPHIGSALSVLNDRNDYEREWLFRRKDGSTFAADVIATQMPDGNLLAMIRDITERRRAEQAIRESEGRFRFLDDLVEATRALMAPEQIMSVTARMLGEHLSASRCAYADVEQDGEYFTILHDYTDGCASTVGRYELSRFGPRAVATLELGETLIIRSVEEELLPGEGAEMFLTLGIRAIITCPLVKEGQLCAMMAVHQASARDWQPREVALVQDVVERCWSTIERRTAEEKIRHLNSELEARVLERTQALEAANKELEAFSYTVSHDLRAPLRAIDGFSQAIIEDFGSQLPEDGQRQLHIIRQSAQRMGVLIDDLLRFSRLGRQALQKQSVDTAHLVQDVLQERGFPRADPRVIIQIGELPACLGDAALLRQVWVNLLDNAFKYSSKRDPAVIEIGSEALAGGVVYHVRDNGTGFDMQYANKLFGVFQRLHRMEDYEGTGVGLATVQRIVNRHGGRVWAESAPERGASFYFTLTPGA